MFKAIGRFLVATAAGAGLGAGAALARRRLLAQADETGSRGWTALEPPFPDGQAPPAVEPTAPVAESPRPGPTAADVEVLRASVADLEAARNRLRERAAALRAEMEGQDR